jgi:hypothetical protein
MQREAAGMAPTTIPVEVVSWITRFIGGPGSGSQVMQEPRAPDSTVRSVLLGLSRRYPELHAALWHGTDLGEHIEVLVNDAVLGVTHELDSEVRPGDRLALIGQFMGG